MIALKKVLVVVADAAKAKFYIAHGPKEIKQIKILEHEASRLYNQELTTKESDFITCPYEDKNSMKHHEKSVFAKEVAETIENTLQTRHLTDICIIASPTFLGELHKKLTHNHVNMYAINKDMLGANDEQILHDIQVAGVTFMG